MKKILLYIIIGLMLSGCSGVRYIYEKDIFYQEADRQEEVYYDNTDYGAVQECYRLYTLQNIKIRSAPSTDAEQTGVLKKESDIHAFDTVFSGGYTWYKITDDQWIADDSTWLHKYYDSSSYVYREDMSGGYPIRILKDCYIYADFDPYTSIGRLSSSSIVKVYGETEYKGYRWLRIYSFGWIIAEQDSYEYY